MKSLLKRAELALVLATLAVNVTGTDAFAQEDAKEATHKPRIIKFYATWCRPCREMAPMMKRVEKRYGDKIDIMSVDVDSPESARLVDEYGVQILPTVVFIAANGDRCVTTGSSEENMQWGIRQIVH